MPLLPRHGEVPSTRPFRMKVECLVRSRAAARESWAHVVPKRQPAAGRAKAAKPDTTSLPPVT
ncbi:MAG: hypothetical protein JSR82_03645 [Verrucomicrobia bacterium]|nr:hypothetical protein [Verrucomicrobiota bacterium]